ncbi:MAG: LOG family protein [Vulcanimicrobiaceae bacterium]
MTKNVCIFCGSRSGRDGRYVSIARDVAQHVVAEGYGIVYGGGRVGLMGVVADAALDAGGSVIGVIPESLAKKEVAHSGLTALHVVGSMHERKALMADLSDGFIALPGGFGTMDELCEILTWAQLRIHAKPVALLNTDGYYDELLALFDKMVIEGFVSPENRALLIAAPAIEDLLAMMTART